MKYSSFFLVYGVKEAPILNPILIPSNLAIGDMLELPCTIKRGKLPISFKWFYNNRQVTDHDKYKVSSSQIGSQLLIGEILPLDIGNYTCQATNSYGDDSKVVSVLIEGKKYAYLYMCFYFIQGLL